MVVLDKKTMDEFNVSEANGLIGKSVIAYRLGDNYVGLEKGKN